MVYTYDEEKTVQENKILFDEYQANPEYIYENMIPEDQDADSRTYTRIKLAIQKESKKLSDFNTAKEQAYTDLETEYNNAKSDAKIALGKIWQEAEDNNYTIPETIEE